MDSEQKFTVETEIIFEWSLEASFFLQELTQEQQVMLINLIGRFLRKREGSYGFVLQHEGRDVYGEVDIGMDGDIYHVYNIMPITLNDYLDLKDKVL